MFNNSCVVFFDGVCNLCNSSVDFLIRIDRKQKLKFASLQSEYAKNHLTLPEKELLSSVVFLKNKKQYIKSEAAVEILKEIGGFYKFSGIILSIFPYWFLNIFYNLIANHRYRFFGKRETCRIPTEDEKKRFIE